MFDVYNNEHISSVQYFIISYKMEVEFDSQLIVTDLKQQFRKSIDLVNK